MKILPSLSVGLAVITLVACNTDDVSGIKAPTRNVARFRNADTSRALASADDELFHSLPAHDVQCLKGDSQDAVALMAAWELVRRSANSKDSIEPSLDSQLLNQFVGFAEGRLRTPLPDGWKKDVLRARANGSGKIYFSGRMKDRYHKSDAVFFVPKGTFVTKGEDAWLVSVGSTSIRLRMMLVNEPRPFDCLTAFFSAKYFYFAVHGDRCSPYEMCCVDRQSGEVCWKIIVSTCGPRAYTGVGFHSLSIKECGDRVLVFGTGDNVAYIESFKKSNGGSIFRFTTG